MLRPRQETVHQPFRFPLQVAVASADELLVAVASADCRHLPALQAVPFLYELRALLDWTCSATPLNWYQWLKLEDIRASLFVEECR